MGSWLSELQKSILYLQKSHNECYGNEQLTFYENDCKGNRKI